MHDAVEEWLDKHSFYCERLQSRLSQEQCAINRRKALHPPPLVGGLIAGPLFKCKTCQEGREVMASPCSTPGCTKRAQHGKDGKCHAHWRQATGVPRKPWDSNRKETTADQAERALKIVESAGKRQVKEAVDGAVPPKATGLAALLGAPVEPKGLTIPFTAEELAVLREFEVTAEHIHHLVIMGLEGKIRPAVQQL